MNALQGCCFGAWLALLAASCSRAEDLKKVCIPTLDCDALADVESAPSCKNCVDCADNWGTCTPGGPACKRGALDLSSGDAGCDAQTSDATAQWVLRSTGQGASFFSFNGDPFQVQMRVSVLAFDEDDPHCVSASTNTCSYTVHALQLEISDFGIPESSWLNGVATLSGPVAAFDQSSAAAAVAPMSFAFEVVHKSERKIALSAALVSVRVTREKEPADASITIEAAPLDFGGYRITDLYFNGELSSN